MENKMNHRQVAILTGISLVLMTIVAGVSMEVVYMPIFELNVAEFTRQFPGMRTSLVYGLLGWITILILDLIVSWGLYKFYENKNPKKSLIMGSLRLGYSIILLIAILQLARTSSSTIAAVESYEYLLSFQSIWQFGLIIFGIHLLVLAPLVCEKRTIRMAISAALFIAGIGYVLSNTLDLFITDYDQMRSNVEVVFIVPMILGELGLAIWLLAAGGKEATSMERQYVSELG